MSDTRENNQGGGLASSLLPELLGFIFELAVQSDVLATGGAHRDAPVNVSMVSKHWRDVSINYTCLWKTISAFLSFPKQGIKKSTYPSFTRHIPLFLRRSGTVLPITFKFLAIIDGDRLPKHLMASNISTGVVEGSGEEAAVTRVVSGVRERNGVGDDLGALTQNANEEGDEEALTRASPSQWVEDFTKVLEYFMGQFHRILTIRMAFHFPNSSEFDLHQVEYNLNSFFARLESLRYLRIAIRSKGLLMKFDLSHNLELQTASIMGCLANVDEDISLSKLTHLELTYQRLHLSVPDVQRLYRSLKRMPVLTSLTYETSPEGEVYYRELPVQLLSLKSLRITAERGGSGAVPRALLRSIVCPSLECIVIYARNKNRDFARVPEFGLPSFIQRSRCSIKRLLLDCTKMMEREVIDTLREAPRARQVVIHNSSERNRAMWIIAPNGRCGTLVKENKGKKYFKDGVRMLSLKYDDCEIRQAKCNRCLQGLPNCNLVS